MTSLAIDTQNNLRTAERLLESIGKSICSVHGGIKSWNAINDALENVATAINNCYLFEED